MENLRLEWGKFIRQNRLTPWICAAAAALSYGVMLSGLRIGVDSEYNMYNPDALLRSWYSINRYSLVWLKNLFGMRMLNPFAENLLMIAVLRRISAAAFNASLLCPAVCVYFTGI